jgi:hypothetical protein
VLVLDTGHELHTDISHKDTKRYIRTPPPDKAKISAFKGWLDQRLRYTSFNPIAFIEANAKARLEMLLAITPLSMSYAEFEAAVGKWVPDSVKKSGASFALTNPLEVLDNIDQSIRDHRKLLNGSIDTLRAHAGELEKAIPQIDEPSNIQQLKAELKSLTEAKDAKIRAAKAEFDGVVNSANEELREREADLRKLMEERIQEAREAFDTTLKFNQQTKDRRITDAGHTKDGAIAAANSDDIARVEQLVKDIGAEEEKGKLVEQAKTTRANIEKARTEAAGKSDESSDCTTRINAIAAARSKLLEQLPIPGMSIKAGAIHYKDILFDTLNTAEQIDVAFQLAERSPGEIKVIIMDNLECLGTDKWAAIKSRADASPCQFIVAKVVSGQPLEVIANGQVEQVGEAPPAAPVDEEAF